MDFDFYTLYQSYSDAELLQVVGRSHEYADAAVVEAQSLLRERGVTDAGNNLISPETFQTQAINPKTGNDILEESILESLLHPEIQAQKPSLWIQAISGIFMAWLAWVVWLNITSFIRFLQYGDGGFYLFRYLTLGLLVLRAATILLLWKRRRWGWFLVVFEITISLISTAPGVYRYYFQESYGQTETGILLWVPVLLRVGLLIGFWQRAACKTFGIRPQERWYAIGAAFAFELFIILLYAATDLVGI
jgi:hypothetical protein